MTFSVYQDAKKEWRWRLVANNGRTLADSGEGYKRVADCYRGIGLVWASKGLGVHNVVTNEMVILGAGGEVKTQPK